MKTKATENLSKSKNIVIFITGDSLGGAEKIITRQFAKSKLKENLQLGIIRRNAKDSTSLTDFAKRPMIKLRELLTDNSKVIHSHLFLAGLFIRVKRIFNKDFYWIHTIHYTDYNGMRFGTIKQWLDKNFIFNSPDKLVAVSEIVYQQIKDMKNSCLINNGINLENKFKERTASDKLTLGCIGMLRPEKGLEDLVVSIKKIIHKIPSVQLKIAGIGPQEEALKELITSNNLSGAVELCGYVNDIDSFLNSLDIYIQPSKSESFGLSVLNAFEHALPVIASDAGNLKILLKDGSYGCLLTRDEEFTDRLSESIQEVSKQLSLYSNKSLNGLEHWKPIFSEEKMLSDYDNLYVKALK